VGRGLFEIRVKSKEDIGRSLFLRATAINGVRRLATARDRFPQSGHGIKQRFPTDPASPKTNVGAMK